MKMFFQKKVFLLLIVLFIVLLSLIGVFVYQKYYSKQSAPFEQLALIEDQIKSENRVLFKSEEAQWMKEKKWENIKNALSIKEKDKNPKSKHKQEEQMIKTIIRLADHGEFNQWSEEDKIQIFQILFDRLTEGLKESSKKLPRFMSLLLHAIGKLKGIYENEMVLDQLVSLLKKSSQQPMIQESLVSNMSKWKTLHPVVYQLIVDKIESKERRESLFALGLIHPMIDIKSKTQLIKRVYTKFRKLDQNVQPFALKLFVLNQHLIGVSLDGLVKLASEKNDIAWDEAKLLIIEKAQNKKQYFSIVNQIQERNQDNLVGYRAKALLEVYGGDQ